jgi:hypothetical protein
MSLRKSPRLTPQLLAARQGSALDRSIDRKVRILLRLRKESGILAPAPAAVGKAGEELKMTERSGNVIENKRPHENEERTGNAFPGPNADPRCGPQWRSETGEGGPIHNATIAPSARP